jgi:methyl coenzyme M reductase subunit D
MSVKCLCGCKVEITNLHIHLKSDKHDQKVIKKNAPTLEKIREIMESLDNVSHKMAEGDYLKKCKKLKDVYEYWIEEHQFKRSWGFFQSNSKVYIHYDDHIGKFHIFDLEIRKKY